MLTKKNANSIRLITVGNLIIFFFPKRHFFFIIDFVYQRLKASRDLCIILNTSSGSTAVRSDTILY